MPDAITSLPGPDQVILFEGLKLPCFNAVELVQGAVISAPLKSNSHNHGVGCVASSDPGGSVQMSPHRLNHSKAISGAVQGQGSNMMSALNKTVKELFLLKTQHEACFLINQL